MSQVCACTVAAWLCRYGVSFFAFSSACPAITLLAPFLRRSLDAPWLVRAVSSHATYAFLLISAVADRHGKSKPSAAAAAFSCSIPSRRRNRPNQSCGGIARPIILSRRWKRNLFSLPVCLEPLHRLPHEGLHSCSGSTIASTQTPVYLTKNATSGL